MRILTVEYASSGFMDDADKGLLVEGFYMLRLISEGLARAGNEVFTMLGTDARDIGNIDSTTVPYDDDIGHIVESMDIDYVFPIAPDAELSMIVDKLSREGIQCISSEVNAIKAAADKVETCRKLDSAGIDTPPIVDANDANYPIIVKNRYGVACEGLRIVDSGEHISSSQDIILQEFVRGENVSVTLFSDGENAAPVSLNKQDIKFENGRGTYVGGEVPLEHNLKKEAFDVAKKAVESIPGFKGCVGVDLVLAEKPYVIEINPRTTTSMIALELASGLNVGEAAMQSFLGKLPGKVEFERRVRFRKESGGLIFEDIE